MTWRQCDGSTVSFKPLKNGRLQTSDGKTIKSGRSKSHRHSRDSISTLEDQKRATSNQSASQKRATNSLPVVQSSTLPQSIIEDSSVRCPTCRIWNYVSCVDRYRHHKRTCYLCETTFKAIPK